MWQKHLDGFLGDFRNINSRINIDGRPGPARRVWQDRTAGAARMGRPADSC
jgi:hypothetical protein